MAKKEEHNNLSDCYINYSSEMFYRIIPCLQDWLSLKNWKGQTPYSIFAAPSVTMMDTLYNHGTWSWSRTRRKTCLWYSFSRVNIVQIRIELFFCRFCSICMLLIAVMFWGIIFPLIKTVLQVAEPRLVNWWSSRPCVNVVILFFFFVTDAAAE